MSDQTHHWILVDPVPDDKESLDTAEMLIELQLDPYDHPLGVRGWKDEKSRHFIVQFKYASSEPVRRQQVGDHLTFNLGKYSNRIRAIEIDVEGLGVSEVVLDGIEKLHEKVEGARIPQNNYRLAHKLLSEHSRDLWANSGKGSQLGGPQVAPA